MEWRLINQGEGGSATISQTWRQEEKEQNSFWNELNRKKKLSGINYVFFLKNKTLE